ncbi:MAG: MMPL family transporter [Nitrospirota bacterium]
MRLITRFVCRRPWAVLAAAALLTLLSGWAAVTRLTLISDQDRLVSEEIPFQRNYLEFLRNFKDQEFLYVVIDGRDAEHAKRFADDLAQRLADHPALIQQVTYRVGPDQLGDTSLLYAETEQLRKLSGALERLAPELEPVLATGRLSALFDWIGRRLAEPMGEAEAELAPLFGALDGLLSGLARALTADAPYASPLAAFSDERLSRYLFTDDGRFLLMLVTVPKDFSTAQVIEAPLAAIRHALDESRAQVPGVAAGLTGRPVLQADEMLTTDRDMRRATIIAIAGVTLLFIVTYGALWRPLLAVLTLLMSIVWALGLAAVTIGSLNLLSAVFTLVIIGVGINWGMHLLARYQEELERERRDALPRAMTTAAVGNLTCAATSAAAFFCALFADFKALKELGFIAGGGIVLSLIAMVTVYPALLHLADRRAEARPVRHRRMLRLTLLNRLASRHGAVLGGVAVLTLLLAPWGLRLRFDDNLLNLQARELESVRWELALMEESRESTWFAAAQAETLEEAERLSWRFAELPTVGKVESLLDVLPSGQAEKRALLAGAAQRVKRLSVRADAPADPAELRRALARVIDGLEAVEEKLFAAGREAEMAPVTGLLGHAQTASAALADEQSAGPRLASFQHDFMADLAAQLDRWRPRLTPDRVTADNAPQLARDRFVGRDGRYLITITPAENIWDPDAMRAFVEALRAVDPAVTGPPVTAMAASRLMRGAFQQTALLSFLAVLALVWLHFAHWRAVLLAFVPLATGLFWLLGAMGALDIPFNLANFFAIPILIGTGIDGGIQMVQRMHEEPARPMLETSTATSVTLSSLTTLLAFGSLMLGQHRGLASLGQIMALGTMSILIATIIILPALHERLIRPAARHE